MWAHYAVDGDLGFEIDAREIPPDWPTGNVPDGKATPFQMPLPKHDDDDGIEAYKLNAGLTDWAYGLTAGMTLPDNDRLKANRAKYTDYPNALKPPFVLEGDTLTADRFWVGGLMTSWAEKWVPDWTEDKGVFVTSAEEDVGYLQALTYLAKIKKVDFNRAMDLRTASDFSIPPPGKTVAEFLASRSGQRQWLWSLYGIGRSGVSCRQQGRQRNRDALGQICRPCPRRKTLKRTAGCGPRQGVSIIRLFHHPHQPRRWSGARPWSLCRRCQGRRSQGRPYRRGAL